MTDHDIDFSTALGFVPSTYAVQMQRDGTAESAVEHGGVCEPAAEPQDSAMAPEHGGVCEPQSDDRDWSDGAQDVSGGTGAVLRVEALLRDLYRQADEAIYLEAQYMRSQGVPESEVARWATSARNTAKAKIRAWDLDVVRILAEQRNLIEYGNKLGPSYDELRAGNPDRGRAPKTDSQIIESARKSNARVNRWAGRLKIAGRIMIAIDVGVAGYQVVTAEPNDRPKVLIKEASGVAGAVAGGWAGAKGGGALGSFGGPWGAAIGAVIGGVGGAIAGGWAGRRGGELLVDQLYPPEDTAFIGDYQ